MTINKLQFEKGLEELRNVSIAPEKKEVIFNTLKRYAETHPVPVKEGRIVATLPKLLRNFLTAISWS